MSMAASSSSSWKYSVFLNFRGEDTRKIFVGHLYRALRRKAINTFIDAEELRKGNDLSELLSAIESSRLSVVVFSQNYASSTWCLKELVKILACMDKKKQIVVPIFYQVDPSEVRKLKRSFAEAFPQNERESNAEMEEVESWRSALTRAANLSGWDSRKYEDDAQLIEEIVDDIFEKLIEISSSKSNGLVGMVSHMHEMRLLLYPDPPGLEKDDVRIVGVWGMGGIGKTTIARAVYDEISCRFEACCFLDNVKDGFMKHGELHMQTQLLSSISNHKVVSSDISSKGFEVMLKSLGKRKVLIVVDDVDKLDQIEALLGKPHSFGGGSRIIITTRDMQLLSRVDAKYKPEIFSYFEALELFRKYAFRTNQPTGDYDHLSRRVVKYAQGLPLALKVLGAFLHNKTVREWEDVLEKIRRIPQKGIHNVLKTSFDGLDDLEQDIFLDIACFLKGMDIHSATKILDSCGFYPHAGIRVLIDQALISVSKWGTLDMHDLLEEMGREIVRQESINEPGRRSRLWSYEDVHHVLTQNTATKAVKGIILYSAILKEGCLKTEAFVSMTNLRLLIIRYNAYINYFDEYGFASKDSFDDQTSSEAEDELAFKDSFDHQTPSDCFIKHWITDLKFQSSQLRCLLWYGCPLQSWPSNFQFKNLVNLDMSNSSIEQLWKGAEPPEKLKFINLSHCEYLKKTPDFTKATSLEELNFTGCTRLYEVDPSISALRNLAILNLSWTAIKELPLSINKLTGLRILNLSGCQELKSLPSRIHMGSLQTLNLHGCSNLEIFPEISEVMEKLSKLDLGRTAIKELPLSINKLTGLTILDLGGCQEIKNLPSSIHIGSLQTLNLHGCSNLEKFSEISDVMEKLSKLDLGGTAIKELPSSINKLMGLTTLDLTGCRELKSLPSSIHMESLRTLKLSGCSNLEIFPEISEVMEELTELHLGGTAIKELHSSINKFTGLTTLDLTGCRELKSLPSSIHMGSFRTLNLRGCSNLEKFPEISDVMEKLSKLDLGGTAIKELPSSINKLMGLTTLDLTGCRELKSLPSSIHMESLRTLKLSGCSNLEMFPEISEVMEELTELHLDGTAIKELPSSINKLTGLIILDLTGCRELKSLPSNIHMGSFRTLNLHGCSNLEKFPEISDVMEKLSKLDLGGTAIKELHSSINKLMGLTTLDLTGCRELKSLPSSIHMGSLRTLKLSGCSNLEMFPEISEVMKELSELHLDETAIKELPSSINKLTGLSILDLRGCRELKSLPSSIHMGSLRTLKLSGCSNLEMFPEISEVMEELTELHLDGTAIKELPSSINKLTGLIILDLTGCRELKSLPSNIHMGSFRTLNLHGCSNLEKFPEISDVMEKLSKLDLGGTAIKELHSSINKLMGLTTLDLTGCRELKSLPSSIHMGSLRTLKLSGCSNLEMFPEISEVMKELSELHLDETAIKELPLSINKLTGLSILDLRGCRELKSLPSSIHMGSLRTLKLSGCSNLEMFPEISEVMEELTELHLDGTAIKELPSSINKLTGLIILDLTGCRELKSLPSNIHMGSFRTLNLHGCSNLEKFPEISDVMEKLSKLDLGGTAIKELHSSINKLMGLTTLDLTGCRELKSLSSSIHMGSLRTLKLSGCSNLEKFPEVSDVMEKLTELHLDGTAIKKLPSSINKFTGLTTLDLTGCQELKSLPSSIHMGSFRTLKLSGCSNLEKFPEISDVMEKLSKLYLGETAIIELPSSINKLTGLTILDLRGCRELKSLPSNIHMGSLQTLNLSGCSNLEKFPEISDVMEKLTELHLGGTAIKELPSSINKFTGLTTLDLTGCRELKSLPSSIHMGSFRTLKLSGCSNLEKFPEISDVMEKLSELHLDGTSIKELPWSIRNLPRLFMLNLRDCKELESLPSSICDLKSLQYVSLSGCAKFEVFPNIVEKMGLKELHLHGTSIKRIPPSIECLHGLVLLNLRNCKSLGSLPDDLCNLVSLTVLTLSGCSNLQNLPEKLGNLESLWNLEVEGSGIKQLPLSLLRLNKLIRLSCHGCKEMTAPFSSWSTSMEDCSHRGLVHLDLSDCNLLELSGIAHLSSLKTLDLCRNNFGSLPAEMNRLHRLTDLKLEGCKRLKSIPELSSSISFIDAHDCTALESVSRPKLLYRNLYFTFSNCFQLVQNLFEYIVEAHQGNLQPLSLFMCLPGSKLSDWFSHQCSGSSVTVHLPPVSDHKILGFAVCGVTKFKYAHYMSDLSAPCFCTFKGEHGECSFGFDLIDWSIASGRLLESDHMFMVYIPWENGVQLSERYPTEATFRVELKDGVQTRDSVAQVHQHHIRRCGVRLFYANREELHNRSMTQPDYLS